MLTTTIWSRNPNPNEMKLERNSSLIGIEWTLNRNDFYTVLQKHFCLENTGEKTRQKSK